MNNLILINFFTVLKNAFNTFDQEKKGSISTDMVGTILSMFEIKLNGDALAEVIAEVDEDGLYNL